MKLRFNFHKAKLGVFQRHQHHRNYFVIVSYMRLSLIIGITTRTRIKMQRLATKEGIIVASNEPEETLCNSCHFSFSRALKTCPVCCDRGPINSETHSKIAKKVTSVQTKGDTPSLRNPSDQATITYPVVKGKKLPTGEFVFQLPNGVLTFCPKEQRNLVCKLTQVNYCA